MLLLIHIPYRNEIEYLFKYLVKYFYKRSLTEQLILNTKSINISFSE